MVVLFFKAGKSRLDITFGHYIIWYSLSNIPAERTIQTIKEVVRVLMIFKGFVLRLMETVIMPTGIWWIILLRC